MIQMDFTENFKGNLKTVFSTYKDQFCVVIHMIWFLE